MRATHVSILATTLFISLSAAAQDSSSNKYRDLGKRDYLEWHRSMCIDISRRHGDQLQKSAKHLQDVVDRTRHLSDERRTLVEAYKTNARRNIEELRRNTAVLRQSHDQLKRIWANWEVALYVSAVTYPLAHVGVPSLEAAKDILFSECMDNQ